MKNNSKNFAFLLVFFIPFLFLFLSYIPNLYEAGVTSKLPQDRQMVWGEHIYTYDYNTYLSKIRQGMEDRWSVVDKYDNHPEDRGVFIQMLYLLSGKAGGFMDLTPVLTFHLLRTILSVAWIITIILTNVYFLKKTRSIIAGIIFSILASSWPLFYKFQGATWVQLYMNWWQEMDVLKRLSYLPHYTLSYISIALFSILIHKVRHFWIICLLQFFLILIQPSGGLLLIAYWTIYYLIKSVWEKKLQIPLTKTLILLICSLIPLFYIGTITASYPWKALVEYEKEFPMVFSLGEYLLSLGPIAITGLIGLILVLKTKEKLLLPIASWVLAALASMIFFIIVPYQSPLRFAQTANHIPLAILSVYALNFVFDKKNLGRLIASVAAIIIIVNGLVQVYFSLKRQMQFIHQRAVAGYPLVPYPPQVMYPLKDFWEAVRWLGNNTKITDVVFSKFTAGNYIPAYAGNFVYFGHTESPGFAARQMVVNEFFSGSMGEDQAFNLLKREGISYIFYGPQEKEGTTQRISRYPFLKPVYNNNYVTIFQCKY